jgi:UDP-N-acetylglucosamine acyltransferase
LSDIHPTAIVSPGARIGEGVRVGPYATIGPNVRVGEGTVIHGHAVLDGWTEIGRNAQIFSFAAVGLIPQDLKYKGEKTTLKVGDATVIREHATLHPGTGVGGGITVVGSGCLIMIGVHIAHDCIIGDRVIIANGTQLGGHVVIDDGAILGALCGIHQFLRIGALAMTAAGSMVSRSVPPYCTVQGDRARLVGLNKVGMRRAGLTEEQIERVKKAYHILFNSKLRLTEALARVERELAGSPEVDRMLKFIRDAEGGIAR